MGFCTSIVPSMAGDIIIRNFSEICKFFDRPLYKRLMHITEVYDFFFFCKLIAGRHVLKVSSSIHSVTAFGIFLTIGFPFLVVLTERIITPNYTLRFYNFQLQVHTEMNFV